MPQVTVIIPTYNRPVLLRRGILSVLDQTFRDLEIVVVDNGSNDDVREIVADFNDKRLKYLRIEKNNGVSPARNLGITNSDSKYVAFLDDDDEWLPAKIDGQVSLMERHRLSVGGVYTGTLSVDYSTGAVIRRVVPKNRGNLLKALCVDNCIGTASTVLLRRECLQKVGLFDEAIRYGEEYDLWIRISREFHFECIEECLVRYTVHEGNATSNYETVINGLEALDIKHGLWFASNSKAYSYRHFTLGELYCLTEQLEKGREAFLKAIKIHPFSVRNYCAFFISLLGTGAFKSVTETGFKLRQSLSLPGSVYDLYRVRGNS